MALMVNNTIAFFIGFFERNSVFERTPKQGSDIIRKRRSTSKIHWGILVEVVVAIYVFTLVGLMSNADRWTQGLPSIVFGLSMIFVIVYQIWEDRTVNSHIVRVN
jgi:hypothetical protein